VVKVSVADAAVAWQQAGVSTIPILPNGTKRPAIKWAEFQGRIPSLDEVNHWWGNGLEYGLALIMGQVSGNVEMTELEGDAVREPGILKAIISWCHDLGIENMWEMLASGYLEQSPSGGLHFLYRIGDADVPGNTKIAMRDSKVLAETRGEGGYVIVAPTPGICHPSGMAWEKVGGEYGELPCISWDQRNLFHEAIQRALGVYAEPGLSATPAPASAPVPVIPSSGAGAELRPGDDFEERTDWLDGLLLGGAGWTLSHEFAGTRHWVRPGKDRRDGSSATTGHDRGRDRLYVFTTSQSTFPVETPITKFRAYSLLHHGGDDSAAASQLRHLGFGGHTPGTAVAEIPDFEPDKPIDKFALSDLGNAHRFVARVGQWKYRWVPEEKSWFAFNGRIWEKDDQKPMIELHRMTEDMARTSGLEKWGLRSQSERALSGALKLARNYLYSSVAEFNGHKDLVSTQNCTINLVTGHVKPHDPRDMITKMVAAGYDPSAQAPKFHAFLESALPDAELRGYVQRVLGRTLLGEPGNRSMFFIYGPSGTGKSQFLELFQYVFGDYAKTTSAMAFRMRREQTATPDLHELRGRRFVSSSETSDLAVFDEEIIKRITGGDTLTTRALYQDFQSWVPECSIWLATNFPPRFTGDDDAIWRRVKLIPFLTRIEGSQEIRNYARTHLFPEADGILQWLLEGLRHDQNGEALVEPETVVTAAEQLREETDPVLRFIAEGEGDGLLVVDQEQRIQALDLYNLYLNWSQRNSERALGRRRFLRRMEAVLDVERRRVQGVYVYLGIGRSPMAGAAGTWVPDKISP
jgi:putative DNA primase/helicase